MSKPSRHADRRASAAPRRVFLLWHADAGGDEKLIGVYGSEGEAAAAVERVRGKPGFSEPGGEFECVAYDLNQDHWTEGFGRPED